MKPKREYYPQTHIQTIGPLMLQLNDLGFGENELKRIWKVYHFALKLWAVNFQSSSRPFICHAVGTASKVAEHGGNLETILAALLHAAYSTGDFGVRIEGVTEGKRRAVRAVAGDIAENLIYRFNEFLNMYGTHWDNAIQDPHASRLTERDLIVMFIRVCNDLDDISDFPFSSEARQQRLANFTHGSIQLAQYIGRADLAKQLEEQESLSRDLLSVTSTLTQWHPGGHIVLPAAFRKKLVPGILEIFHRWRKTGSPLFRD